MSVLFDRPNPEQATVNDIKTAIEEITEWDWTTGYTFAHIVIDDKNLEDGHILFCLEPSRIADVINQKLIDRFDTTKIYDLERWQWGEFEDIVTHMAEVIDLLNWLLKVPEKIRNEYDG